MSERLRSDRPFCTFNVIDDFNREAMAIEIDTSSPSSRIVRSLDTIAAWRGFPRRLRSVIGLPPYQYTAIYDRR